MHYDVIIIGGGAAGLTAALSASAHGAGVGAGKVLVLEGASRVGRKILASGNGRCNLANMRPADYPGNDAFAFSVLQQRPVREVLDFFHDLGLVTVEEAEGRVYPGCGQASAVLDVLRGAMERRGISVLCDQMVNQIERTENGLRVYTRQGVYSARSAVAACGGMAGGKLGHDGSAYRLLTDLGHTLIPPRPALCPLTGERNAVKGLSGLRLPAILTLCRRKDGLFVSAPARRDPPIACPIQGEALFTDYGVSGVCAMQLARSAVQEAEESGVWPMLYMDFSPMLGLTPRRYGALGGKRSDPLRSLQMIQTCLEKRQHILPREQLLQGLAPRLLAEKLKGQSIPQLARSLAAFPVPLTGVKGMEFAQVTSGGISVEEFNWYTLESLIVPGLFAAGEMLDVDGDCGGYNLQFAFASGWIAGENAARAALPK